ncbi:MAG: DeoR/GlpR transcriptional regulator [Treponema sp.]|nr:DeoR/GlpR transcriptional regulator [Treponema sp.]
MKNSRWVIFNRQNQILQKLHSVGSATIEDMAQEFAVSPLTIRRDLDALSQKGFVERFHGGARHVSRSLSTDPATELKTRDQEIRKRLIAEHAARMVEDDDTIFINSSTTALYMLEFLAARHVTIITNNANALSAVDASKFILVFTGGEINPFKHSMVGSLSIQMLKAVHASKCFIGVSGINAQGQLSSAGLKETTVNICMMEQTTTQVVVLADSSKIGVQHNFTIGSLDQVSYVVTDDGVTEQQRAILSGYAATPLIARSTV